MRFEWENDGIVNDVDWELVDVDDVNWNIQDESIRQDEAFRMLEEMNIKDIEAFLRLKKLERINNK